MLAIVYVFWFAKTLDHTPIDLTRHTCVRAFSQTLTLRQANVLKQEGNIRHAEGNYEEAIQKFMAAKRLLETDMGNEATTLSNSCSLNIVSCYILLKQWDKAINICSEVLITAPSNFKALYRRGLGLKALVDANQHSRQEIRGMLDMAYQDLSKAKKQQPYDPEVNKTYRELRDMMVQHGMEVEPEEVTNLDSSTRISTHPDQNPWGFPTNGAPRGATGAPKDRDVENVRKNPEAVRRAARAVGGMSPEILATLIRSRTTGGESCPENIPWYCSILCITAFKEESRLHEASRFLRTVNVFAQRMCLQWRLGQLPLSSRIAPMIS
jgi:tetratricopeptide (TPR) repeat protein